MAWSGIEGEKGVNQTPKDKVSLPILSPLSVLAQEAWKEEHRRRDTSRCCNFIGREYVNISLNIWSNDYYDAMQDEEEKKFLACVQTNLPAYSAESALYIMLGI